MWHARVRQLLRVALCLALTFVMGAAVRADQQFKRNILQTGSVSETSNTALGTYSLLAITNTFDKQGNLIGTWITNYFSGFGTTETGFSSSINSYDKKGQVIATLGIGYSAGFGSNAFATSYTYDQHGNLIQTVNDTDAGADGTVDSRTTITYTNFPNGSRETITYDYNNDGVPDAIWAGTWTYDKAGRIVRAETETDSNADGVIDLRGLQTWAYDDRGRLLQTVTDIDSNADGVADSRTTLTWTYDLAHDRMYWLYTYEPNADGVVDPNRTARGTITTDDHGVAISEVDTFADGHTSEYSYVYDKFGNLVHETGLSNGDSSSETITYAHRGQVIRSAPHPNFPNVLQVP